MDFKLTSEQQLLQDSVRRYVDKAYGFEVRAAQLAPMAQAATRREAGLAHWQAFADNGWLAAALPETHGGLGGSLVETALIAHELGRGLLLEPYLGCAVLAAQTLAAGGSAAQLQRWLPALADGSRRMALDYSERGARGLPLPLTTWAERRGSGYVLGGRKTLVLSGGLADAYLVSARVEGAGALTLFVVDAAAAGLRRQALPLHDGRWAEELVLEDVAVDADAVLGEPGGGLPALRTGLAHGIVAQGAELVGAMERVIELSVEYLKTRRQFGVAIGSFQALQHRVADMAAEMEMARSMLYAALAAMAGSEADGGAQRQRTLSGAKALIGRVARFVCGQGIQLHGGIGMTEEYAVGHYFKRAVVADLVLGSSERHEAACALALG